MRLFDIFKKKASATSPPQVNDRGAIIALLRSQKKELINRSYEVKNPGPGHTIADIGLEVQKIIRHVTTDARDIKFASNLARYQLPRLIELLKTYVGLQGDVSMEAATERDRSEKVFAQMLESVRVAEDLCRRNDFESFEFESRTLDAVLCIQK